MTFSLRDIRTAVIDYVDKYITVSITDFKPATGTSVNRDEEFSFKLNAKNPDSINGGIRLKDLIWYVWVEDDNICKLIVPNGPMVPRSGLSANSSGLTPGSKVSAMYLHSVDIQLPQNPRPRTLRHVPDLYVWGDFYKLDPGEMDSVTIKGTSMQTGGYTYIYFKIYADIDMDWLFPRNQDSAKADHKVRVID